MTNTPDDPFMNPQSPDSPSSAPQTPQAPGFHGQPEYGQPQPNQSQYAQPQYPQAQYGQPQYAPPYGPNPQTAKNWMGVTALVLSLASLITGITAIGGIIFGHMSVAAAKRGEADNAGLGRAGLILGYIFTALMLLAIVGFVLFFIVVANECSGAYPADWCA